MDLTNNNGAWRTNSRQDEVEKKQSKYVAWANDDNAALR
jgi:hypothetical protein